MLGANKKQAMGMDKAPKPKNYSLSGAGTQMKGSKKTGYSGAVGKGNSKKTTYSGAM